MPSRAVSRASRGRTAGEPGISSRTLDGYLENRRWLVGNGISYADFRVATSLPFAQGARLPLAEFPNVRRRHDELWEIDAWRAPFDGLT